MNICKCFIYSRLPKLKSFSSKKARRALRSSFGNMASCARDWSTCKTHYFNLLFKRITKKLIWRVLKGILKCKPRWAMGIYILSWLEMIRLGLRVMTIVINLILNFEMINLIHNKLIMPSIHHYDFTIKRKTKKDWLAMIYFLPFY